MPNTLIAVNPGLAPEDQQPPPHNRWHPAIPPVASVEPGEVFRVECLDATGGQILNDDSADDVRLVDLTQVLFASGPIGVAGAKPGDLLVVNVLDIGPLAGAEWGYTVVFDRSVGAGLLAEDHPEARKAIWDLNGVFATSRHIQGVRLTGVPHPALLGCAPSREMLRAWNLRERAFRSAPADPFVAAVSLPTPEGALLGALRGDPLEGVAAEAARTWAARENGGHMDVTGLTPGSRALLPVNVPGANLSVGDLQFSQGEGKINGFGGVKMSGWIDLEVEVIPDGMRRFGISDPVFEPHRAAAGHCGAIAFQGIAVGEHGSPHYRDLWVAFAHAYRCAVRHLERFGYSPDQAYALLAAAPIQERITGGLGHPNVCCTVILPTEIFEFDVDSMSAGQDRSLGELARAT